MKKIAIIALMFCILSCKKEPQISEDTIQTISNDSMLQILHAQWKFEAPAYSDPVYYVMNNWNEWREMIHSLNQKPAKSMNALQKKTTDLVAQVEKVALTIPEGYQQNAVISRINLLQTHAYNLDMLLELQPIPYKEVLPIYTQIQKDLISIANQFEEIHTKKNIPREMGETAVQMSVDTVKRATVNAIPTE